MKGEPATPEPPTGAPVQGPPVSTAMVAGLVGLLGVPVGLVGLCWLSYVVLVDEDPPTSFSTAAAVTATGVLSFLVFVASIRFEVWRLGLPVRARHPGWNVLQWISVGALIASTMLLFAILVMGAGARGPAATGAVAGFWLGAVGLAAFFALAPPVRADPSTSTSRPREPGI